MTEKEETDVKKENPAAAAEETEEKVRPVYVVAVSYTHLEFIFFRQHHVAVQRQKTAEFRGIKHIDALIFTFSAVEPVSYTHLDVYKRQPQTYDYFKKIQDRITGFISGHCDITQDRLEELMLETGMLTKDMGTILVGGEAVEEGLINEIGGIREALDKLYELIETDDNAGQTRRFGQRNQGQQENNGNQQE